MSIHPAVDRDPAYQLWADYRREFTVEGDKSGFRRLEYPALNGATFCGRLIVLLPAQAAETMSRDGDAVFLVVSGDVEFTVDGKIYPTGERDLLAIPAGTPFSYINVGMQNVVLCGLFAAAEDAQKREKAETHHMIWAEYKRDFHWTLPYAEIWGYHRGSGPLIRPPALRGHTVRMPSAQSTPWHYAPRDLLFMPVHGEVEFAAAGKVWPLARFDMLLIPAFTPYSYRNYGLEEVFFLSIGGRLEAGKKGAYFDGDPGWPVRPDARMLVVEVDPYGDAKIKA